MAQKKDNEKQLKIEVKPGRAVSDGRQEVTVKCVIVDSAGKPPRDDIPVTLTIKKHKISEELVAKKGVATFKFKPLKPTGKTLIQCSSDQGESKAYLHVAPTAYQYTRDTFQAIILAFIVAFGLIRPFIIQTYYIPSGSMEPTMYEGDRLLAFMFTYRFRDPRPGEIIIFDKDDDCSVYKIPVPLTKDINWKFCKKYIKRVIATGGDTVSVADLTVYVNGKPLDEPYVKSPPLGNFPEFKVPKNSFFMMGDNRNNSADSRVWGALPREKVVSKAIVRYWPLSRIGVLRQDPIKTK